MTLMAMVPPPSPTILIIIITVLPIPHLPCQVLRQFRRLGLGSEYGRLRVVLLVPVAAAAGARPVLYIMLWSMILYV